MSKYLADYNWQPLVVTNHWTSQNCSYDPDCVQNLPEDIPVAKIDSISTNINEKGLFGFLGRENWQKTLNPGSHPKNWSLNVKKKLKKLLDLQNVDAIWATYCPNANFYLARYFSKELRRPWIADFRDEPGQFGKLSDIRYRFMVYRMIAAQIHLVRSASAITTVTKGLADTLKQRHQREISIIMNGFDPQDMSRHERTSFPKFTLVHAGELNSRRSPKPILDALAMLVEKKEISIDDLAIKFYGQNNIQPDGKDFFLSPLLQRYQFEKIATVHPRVSRKICDQACINSTVLLLLREPGEGFVPSKLFAYFTARRPILALSNNSDDVQQIISQTGVGRCCNSVHEIADLLLEWYKEWKLTGTVKYFGIDDEILRYSRKEQASQLAQLLDTIVLGF
jgi:hypothetical protein